MTQGSEEAAAESQAVYEGATDTLSKLVRQLGFAAIAIVWLFSEKKNLGAVIVGDDFTRAAIFAVAALALDVIQYAYLATAYFVVFRRIEKGSFNVDRDGGPFPTWLPTIGWVVFGLKVAAIAVAYCLLGIALWSRLS